MSLLLETKNLTLKIADKVLCRDLDFDIKAEEVIGLIGPNGSGKTTLLKTLAGLLEPSTGEIFLAGKKLSVFSEKTLARERGILFQDTQDVFPQTVYEYCSGGRYPYLNYFTQESEEDKNTIKNALSVMGLQHHAEQSIQTLSGGERRRLAIAALLAQEPTIYLLDEPMNHLDLHFQLKVADYFKQLAKQRSRAVLMALHDINLAALYCDRILMLCGDGTFLLGTPPCVFSKENLERIYQCSFASVMLDGKQLWVPYKIG